ncbi:MAG: HD domain-containing protein [Deltaproteobacteria bacterium]|nr:HD domain-containing protein [Deltaproteobacteria bacterium]
MKKIANFLFEVGMLKKTPRTGYQFLGSGSESVADHSFRTAIIGYILACEIPGADKDKTVLMCLFHDLHEARTGDQNYVNKRYNTVDEEKAVSHMTSGLPFGDEITRLTHEFNGIGSIEASIAKDADQIDLILELKQQKDLGNRYADEWLFYAKKRLINSKSIEMVEEILKTDHTEWWFDKRTELWVNGSGNNKDSK